MIDKFLAESIKRRSLSAIAELDAIVSEAQDKCSAEEIASIRGAVGLVIAHIAEQLLEPVFQQYPEIDDLR